MTGSRLDLPWNFPADWNAPKFVSGEIPVLAMEEGERIIASQKALVLGNIRTVPDLRMLKAGVACYRLGYLFEKNREAILSVLSGESRPRRSAEEEVI